jgi:hypothetical protein
MMSDPSVVSEEVSVTRAVLELPTTLLGGTLAMQAAGEKFLPKETAEDTEDYNSRVKRSFLFSAYARTLEILVGEAFDKPATLSEDIPQEFQALSDNIDYSGSDITSFAADVLYWALNDGVGFVLVDAPPLPKDENGNPIQTTAAEDQVLGRRPYWVHIPFGSVLGALFENVNGTKILTQFRWVEVVDEQTSEYETESIQQIRVLSIGGWEIWREYIKDGKKEWLLYDFGTTGLDYIPLVSFFTGKKIKNITAKPPLRGLAELNLAHWVSSSDQNNILHFARVPILFGKGLMKDDSGSIVISPRNLFHTDNPDGDLKFVEHTGTAISDGWKDLENLEQKMSLWGMNLVIQNRSGNITATENALAGAKVSSFLNSVVVELQKALNLAKLYTCDYLGIADSGQIALNTDFSLALRNFDNKTILDAYSQGLLDRATAIEELKRRGTISEDADPIEIAAALLEEQRQAVGMV